MSANNQHKSLMATIGCCLTAACLAFAPASLKSTLHSFANDALSPGQRLLNHWVRHKSDLDSLGTAVSTDDAFVSSKEVAKLRGQLRYRELQLVELKNQLADDSRMGRFPFETQRRSSLIVPELLKAKVLSRIGREGLVSSIVIDKGLQDNLQDETWVVDSTNPIIDQGEDQNMKTGQPVYAGRCVIGRIEKTGRWTSSLQLITDPKYSGRARLARRTSNGLQFGAEGILEGSDDGLCHLSGIPTTQPVAVGDEVFTGGNSFVLKDPMYYGKVVRAQLLPGSVWDVVVQPEFKVESLEEVVVLRATLNPIRILGQ